MGWKLELGILGAVILGLLVFRKQISGAFAEAGGAVGESIGGFFGSIPSGISSAGSQALAPLESWWGGVGDFLLGGGYAGQYFKEQRMAENTVYGSTRPEAGQIIIGGSQPTNTDAVVTPYTRDYSDIVTSVEAEYGMQLNKFEQIMPQAQARGFGHADAAEYAEQSAGVSPQDVFEITRQRVLDAGGTPAEALRAGKAAIS